MVLQTQLRLQQQAKALQAKANLKNWQKKLAKKSIPRSKIPLCPRMTTVEGLSCDLNTIDYVFGIDEVGVACLAGPVVAACFAYPMNALWAQANVPALIRDSKQLSEGQRRESETWLREQAPCFFAIAEASPKEIDEINIFWASRLAMFRAFEAVRAKIDGQNPAPKKRSVLVDGNQLPKEFAELGSEYHTQALVKGDTRVFAIAAASIIAKNYRDELMQKLSREFPQYGWETNVGYPTEVHRKALMEFGPTAWHRRSFRLDYSEVQTQLL